MNTTPFFSVALWPNTSHDLLILEVPRSHTTTHYSRYSSESVTTPTARAILDSTQHSQKTSMSPEGFGPTVSEGERPQTYALDRAATGTGK